MAKKEDTPEAEENAGGEQTEQPASTGQPEAVPETPESKEIPHLCLSCLCSAASSGHLLSGR
ncbi:MAG: hypothetical protein ACYS9C_16140 [Planctomycetota bacterium]|jgi:hypothetical protein